MQNTFVEQETEFDGHLDIDNVHANFYTFLLELTQGSDRITLTVDQAKELANCIALALRASSFKCELCNHENHINYDKD